jgi:hypothetical protein
MTQDTKNGAAFTLERNSFGRLTLTDAAGTIYDDVQPVRAFPIQAPEEGVAIVCPDGKEAAWITDPGELDAATRQLIDDALTSREFMPEIRRIESVTSFATPCTWQVDTDKGATEFVLRGDEDIRRFKGSMLLIADNHGIHFLIRDMAALDRHSRKILERFL